MRLIDADKLPISFDGHTVSVWKNDIDNAPTVEAIPVEWLCRKYLDINKKNWSAVICLVVNKIIYTWEKRK